MKSAFIGRHKELALIDRTWESPQAALMVLYGRRRVGKTRLLTHWMKRHADHGLYWMAEATSAYDQLRSFSQALANFADPESIAPLDFTYANWDQAFRQVSLLARNRRIALFIDEVNYLMAVNPSLIGTLQKAWDHWLSDSNLLLALSGSQMGMMQKQLLSYQAPLYGRATAQFSLPPLPFSATKQFFPDYNAAERVMIYAIWGGIPAYWERLDPSVSVLENLRLQLQPSNAWMLDEPRLLLQDFLTDLYNYVGIMRAIASGEQTLSGIGKRAGLSSGHTSKYLSILRSTGFVDRQVPVTERSTDSRRGRYFVTDPYLRFYYRFLAPYQSKLALGQDKQMLVSIEHNLPGLIQDSTWQELCREWLLLASAQGELPTPIEHVGSEWKRINTFDVVGISEEEKCLILGKCLWDTVPAGVEMIHDLVKRTPSIIPTGDEDWKVYYIGFAAGGWTENATTRAEAIIADDKLRGRRKWQPIGVRLVDLETLDADFDRWSGDQEPG
ncbi:MAG: ATP-binding protein [Anaerolineales bacterium]|nr:ATP-binding protein [Anaerolineales bacterium]MCB8965847.1 ATP-binding protein [Ardenticatenaceae bacterium]